VAIEMTAQDRPLITFALLAYNQERFIREAVEGAFSQTYTPLEIIISDDCSTDRTFEIIKEMSAGYRGLHTIILNQNEHNLGISGHVNRIMEIAKGELIVGAAGDDVSLPNRVSTVHKRWKGSNKQNKSIFTNMMVINQQGNILDPWLPSEYSVDYFLKEVVYNGTLTVIGCTHAWAKELFDLFGPLPPSISREDYVIPFRALILGSIEYLDIITVKYRRHGNNIWQRAQEFNSFDLYNKWTVKNKSELIKIYKCWLRDLECATAMGKITWEEFYKFKTIINNHILFQEKTIIILGINSFKKVPLLANLIYSKLQYQRMSIFAILSLIFPRFDYYNNKYALTSTIFNKFKQFAPTIYRFLKYCHR
jgi:glycosyltransferase involved in cell wall biosynthesis